MVANISRAIETPKVKSTVIPIPLSNERLALHRGPFKADRQLLIVPDPGGVINAAMAKMDGTRSVRDVATALRASGFPVADSLVLEIIQTLAQHGVIADDKQLSVATLDEATAARYSRNLNCWASITSDERTAVDIQEEIGGAHVLVLGVGGIGTAVALSLTMAGCGQLTLVDFDLVELSNLNRQLLFTVDDIGKPKVEVAKLALQRVNPTVKITAINARLGSAAAVHELIRTVRPDFVSDAIDRPTVAIDRWINHACFAECIPYSANSVSGNTALFWTKIPMQTGCYSCDELWASEERPDQFELTRYRETHDLIAATSALGVTAMTIGALTASEIIRVILKWPAASAGRSFLVEFSTLKVFERDRPAHPHCTICGAGSNAEHVGAPSAESDQSMVNSRTSITVGGAQP